MIDYTSSTADMAARPWREWLRTYRDHQRGEHYLADPGHAGHHQRRRPRPAPAARPRRRPRPTSCGAHGLDELVEEGRRTWAAQAAAPDLAALTARSRVREAEALTDPAGLGGFTVAEWLIA